ncbi:hypothetical protein YC2023_062446 [Brassica napus]
MNLKSFEEELCAIPNSRFNLNFLENKNCGMCKIKNNENTLKTKGAQDLNEWLGSISPQEKIQINEIT